MAIEISMEMQFPQTVEIEVPVEMQPGTELGYPAILRTAEIAGATRNVIRTDAEGREVAVAWKSGGAGVRVDTFEYTENYIIQTRIGAGSVMKIRTETATGRVVILEDDSTGALDLEFMRNVIRNNPGVRLIPVGTEVTVPWEAEDGTEYECVLVLVDYQYMTVEEDPEGDPVWCGIFWTKYAALHPMQYDAAERERRHETKASAAYKYYNIVMSGQGTPGACENLYTASVNPGDTIPSSYSYKYGATRNSNPILYGSPCYGESAARKYLNSAAAAGEWWTSSHVGDAAPQNAGSVRGYLAGFSEDDLALFRSVKIDWMEPAWETGGGDPTEESGFCRFWLPSLTEMYFTTVEGEGTAWAEYWQAVGIAEPSVGNKTQRIIYRMDKQTEAVEAWLRSSQNIAYQYYINRVGSRVNSRPGRGPVTYRTPYGTYAKVEDIEKYMTPVCAVG